MVRVESSAERRARQLVERELAGGSDNPVRLQFCDNDPYVERRHDYWITVGRRRIGALEVTTLADERIQTNLETWGKYGPPPDLRLPGLSYGWPVTVDAAARPRRVLRDLAGWLLALERAGVDDLRVGVSSAGSDPMIRTMAQAGVGRVSHWDDGSAGQVTIRQTAWGPARRFADRDPVVTTVEAAVGLPKHTADVAKLAATGMAVQHLFWWISYSRWDVVTMAGGRLPTRPPQLPATLTAVWLVPAVAPGQETPALRWSTSAGWQRFIAAVS